jgi:phenylalanyl-tRNA synthetase beta chain
LRKLCLSQIFCEDKIKETESLCISLTPGNFTQIKQILEYISKNLEINLEIQNAEDKRFIQGRIGKIKYKEKEIGNIGEINPSILKNFHLKMPVSLLEINLSEIF